MDKMHNKRKKKTSQDDSKVLGVSNRKNETVGGKPRKKNKLKSYQVEISIRYRNEDIKVANG